MAIACLRLFTFLPDRPLFSVPCFRSLITRATFRLAAFFFAAMLDSSGRFRRRLKFLLAREQFLA